MGLEFYNTKTWQQFANKTLPNINRNLGRIADALEEHNKQERNQGTYLVFCKDLRHIRKDDSDNSADLLASKSTGKCLIPEYMDAYQTMLDHIRQVADREYSEKISEDMQTSADLDLQYGSYAAELFKDDQAVFHWNIVKVA